MYRYSEADQRLVEARARQFRGQVERRIEGSLTEEEFRPLRLQNGLYLQLHAYMLRVAIPYGLLSSTQLRALAQVARRFDRGYGHFTTRQNIQFNWIRLVDVPDILDALASVQMHAIQTSGNCVRNITSDPLAGVATDEDVDPRPYCELVRQWSTFHPEFAYLPRKFKIAITGSANDRAAIAVHDVGIRARRGATGVVFDIDVGGGQGRTPLLAERLFDGVPESALLAHLEGILRVYNELGRRDNPYKARIKILVKEMGVAEMRRRVEEELATTDPRPATLEPLAVIRERFELPAYRPSGGRLDALRLSKNRSLARWVDANVLPHRVPGHAIVEIAMKGGARPPGDVTAAEMERLADLADRFAYGRVVVTHRQNLVFPDVPIASLEALHVELTAVGLDAPVAGHVSDMIACPGLDYCDLANARSIPLAQKIQEVLDPDFVEQLGRLTLNISGCINACGHHHVANIGILGIDKQGEEHYQITLGGNHTEDAAIGKILGRALAFEEVPTAIERLLSTYLELRASPSETFLTTYRRVGAGPFKEAVYGSLAA